MSKNIPLDCTLNTHYSDKPGVVVVNLVVEVPFDKSAWFQNKLKKNVEEWRQKIQRDRSNKEEVARGRKDRTR